MLQIRYFEEKVAYFFSRGLVHGTTHLYSGEEATAVGAISALNEDDFITSTHRGHGHCIAKGIDLRLMMAELLGRATGICKGKGGSMHIADLRSGNLGANGIVGGGLAIATGAGLSIRMKKTTQAVICFFGDGAINEGIFHESVNLAAIWKLPVIFLCENNQYGMSMSVKRSVSAENLADRAKAYDIPGVTMDGNDVEAVYATVSSALSHVREKGPQLLISETYRFMGHSKSDANRYRTKSEIAAWKKKDPVSRLEQKLLAASLCTEEELRVLQAQARKDIEDAVTFAQESPHPSIDTIQEDVYA